MYVSMPGIYRDGRIELIERPRGVMEETEVIVTFLDNHAVDLRSRGIDENQASELRGQLASFAEDWNSPEMDAYDDYDAAIASR